MNQINIKGKVVGVISHKSYKYMIESESLNWVLNATKPLVTGENIEAMGTVRYERVYQDRKDHKQVVSHRFLVIDCDRVYHLDDNLVGLDKVGLEEEMSIVW